MKTFYRLEGINDAGKTWGVYGVMGVVRDILRDADLLMSGERSPSPDNDNLFVANARKKKQDVFRIRFVGEWRFGFTSKEMLFKWFTPEVLKKLTNVGVKIKRIPRVYAKDMIVGDRQAVIKAEVYDALPYDYVTPEQLA